MTTVPMSLLFLRGQVGYMRERGFDVHAVCSSGPEAAEFSRREGVPVTEIEMVRRITPGRDLLALARLYGLIRRIRPHIVHAHTPKGGLLGMLAAALAGVPVRIYHIRGLPFVTARGPKRWLLWITEFLTAHLAHAVLCVSHSVRQRAAATGICRPDHATVLANGSGNGVDAEFRFNPSRLPTGTRLKVRKHFGIPDEATVIGFVGRIVRDKGIPELAQAWTRLRSRPDLHLLLVGPIEGRDPVPSATLELLRTDNRVHFAGYHSDLPPIYAAMDVVALPSHREGFPNVPLEAAAMGLPVVATRVPGCIDALSDGVTGTLVPMDTTALTGALNLYISDPTIAAAHGSAGRIRVLEQYKPEDVWSALHDFYLAKRPTDCSPAAHGRFPSGATQHGKTST